MVQCPTCGVTLYSSDRPENVLANHRAEQHPDVKPIPTFADGYEHGVAAAKYSELLSAEQASKLLEIPHATPEHVKGFFHKIIEALKETGEIAADVAANVIAPGVPR